MGKLSNVWWVFVEVSCRILGVSTSAVLCAVGVETLQQGEFNSLGIYLLVSSFGVMLFEMAYFLDAMLFMCLPCPPDWKVFTLWGKMARVGGFHKFLYYCIMSLVCFLHPVLVWHAVIPGAMLLVTALFNFTLSKKPKNDSPKRPQQQQQHHHGNQGPDTNVCVMDGVDSGISFSFLKIVTGGRRGVIGPGIPPPEESFQAMLQTHTPTHTHSDSHTHSHTHREKRWKERMSFKVKEEPMEREMEEMDGYSYSEQETTSDTVPMIV